MVKWVGRKLKTLIHAPFGMYRTLSRASIPVRLKLLIASECSRTVETAERHCAKPYGWNGSEHCTYSRTPLKLLRASVRSRTVETPQRIGA